MHDFHGWEQGLFLNWVNPDEGAWCTLWSSGSSMKGYFPQFLPVLLKSLLKALLHSSLKQKKESMPNFSPLNKCLHFFKSKKTLWLWREGFQQRLWKWNTGNSGIRKLRIFCPCCELCIECGLLCPELDTYLLKLLSFIPNFHQIACQNRTLWEVYQVVRCTWSKAN